MRRHFCIFMRRLFCIFSNRKIAAPAVVVLITAQVCLSFSWFQLYILTRLYVLISAGSINISNILTGKCLAKIRATNSPCTEECACGGRCSGKSCSSKNRVQASHIRSTVTEALEDITALFYDEERNEIYTGNRHGLVHVWSNWSMRLLQKLPSVVLPDDALCYSVTLQSFVFLHLLFGIEHFFVILSFFLVLFVIVEWDVSFLIVVVDVVYNLRYLNERPQKDQCWTFFWGVFLYK